MSSLTKADQQESKRYIRYLEWRHKVHKKDKIPKKELINYEQWKRHNEDLNSILVTQ